MFLILISYHIFINFDPFVANFQSGLQVKFQTLTEEKRKLEEDQQKLEEQIQELKKTVTSEKDAKQKVRLRSIHFKDFFVIATQ